MTDLAGSLSERSALDVVQNLHAWRATGVLEIDSGGQRRRLHFVDGELHLPGAHPLARRLAQEVDALRSGLASNGETAIEEGRRRLLQLVERMARVIADWRAGEFRFDELPAPAEGGLVGPLPTRRLVMLGAAFDLEEEALLARLGGPGARLVAGLDSAGDSDLLGLSPEERFLLERLSGPLTVDEVLASARGERGEILRRLVELAAVSLVTLVGLGPTPGAAVDRRLAEDRTMIDRLAERIGRSLAERPLDLDETEHRRRVGELLARFGGLDHYELLGLRADAPEARVQEAFEEVGRLVHPSHAPRLGLARRESALRLLFERATSAYRTLSDPEARRRYNAAQLIDIAPALGGEARLVEQREMARSSYERGLAFSLRGDIHSAIQLLEQAVTLDRRAEYLRALARNLARNPAWRQRALEALRGALELDPHNAEVRYEIGLLHEELGDAGRARASYAAALRSDPAHAAAAGRMEKLRQAERGAGDRGKVGSLFDRIFRRS